MRHAAYAFAAMALIPAAALAQATPPDSAMQSAPATATPATSGAAQVTAGAQVSDTTGAAVGTIDSVANGNATVNTGTTKVAVPVASFAQGPNGLVLSMSRAQLESAVASAKPATIAVGTSVVGPKGATVGTVSAVTGDLVTVQTAHTKVQLPKSAFAQQGSGLVIGLTADQLEAAAKNAKPGG